MQIRRWFRMKYSSTKFIVRCSAPVVILGQNNELTYFSCNIERKVVECIKCELQGQREHSHSFWPLL